MMKLSIRGVRTIFFRQNFIRVSNYTTITTKTSKIPNSMVDYLVNSLGFSKDEAFVTSSKVSSFKSTVNPNSVVDFLRSSGFSQTQINSLVSRVPKILSINVDNTLKPKIQALHELGFSKSDLAHVICLSPNFCWRSLNDHIVPTLEMLKSFFGDDSEVMINVVKKSPWLLSASAKKGLPDVFSLLESYGLSESQIKLFALRKTRYLSLGTEALERILIRVEKLGIPRGSGMFFHGICVLCSLTEANLELKMGIHKSYGFTDADVLTLFRKHPFAFLISESKLRTRLDFFINDARYQPDYIVSTPWLLSYSLENRVIPRYIVWKGLKEREIQKVAERKLRYINVTFVTCLGFKEPQFFERFVEPFKDQCPDLYTDYVKMARPVLKTA